MTLAMDRQVDRVLLSVLQSLSITLCLGLFLFSLQTLQFIQGKKKILNLKRIESV